MLEAMLRKVIRRSRPQRAKEERCLTRGRAIAAATALAATAVLPGAAFAQSEAPTAAPPTPAPSPAGGEGAPGSGSVTVVTLPPGPAPSAPAPPDPNAHLPSSSRVSTDTSRASDGFDLRSQVPGTVVHGNPHGAYVVSGQYVPDIHTAKRGDTLWDISNGYFGNPYNWPRIWSYNKQIQNPHWIYPGDHIRLRGDSGVRQTHLGFVRPGRAVSPDTIFLRNVGFVQDGKDPVWGEIVGSAMERMILAEQDETYIQLDDKHDVTVGQQLQVIESMDVDNVADAEFVYIRGVVEIDRYNPKTHMARARIVESFETIERNCLVMPLDRVIDVVRPSRNRKAIQANIIGALYPHEFYGQHQVVVIDKGSKDGVEAGNRFFAVTRGDPWRQNLRTVGSLGDKRAITEDDRNARIEDVPDHGEDSRYPSETYGEVLVVRVREKTATAIVTASVKELPRGALLVAQEGY